MSLPTLRTDWASIDEVVVAEAVTAVRPAPPARPLGELICHATHDPDELIRHRYLCRGGGMLLVGPTGIGKSSFAMQCMILWALGLSALGIHPSRALKSLLIQAENDDGDLAEMRDGVMRGLELTEAQMRTAQARVLVVNEDIRTGATFFEEVVRPLLIQHRPDLLWIDPVLAYLGGDTAHQKDVGAFLRNGLNALLRELRCGAVLIHHTNKPPSGQEKPNWSAGDFAYAGSGSAEWANWSRAVLALRSIGSHSVFELLAAKRGNRLDWRHPDGLSKTSQKFITHASETGGICWREAGPAEVDAAESQTRKAGKTRADLMALVPLDQPIAKSLLLERGAERGIGLNRARGFINSLVEDGTELFEWERPRPGKRPIPYLARVEQPRNAAGDVIFTAVITPNPTREVRS